MEKLPEIKIALCIKTATNLSGVGSYSFIEHFNFFKKNKKYAYIIKDGICIRHYKVLDPENFPDKHNYAWIIFTEDMFKEHFIEHSQYIRIKKLKKLKKLSKQKPQ